MRQGDIVWCNVHSAMRQGDIVQCNVHSAMRQGDIVKCLAFYRICHFTEFGVGISVRVAEMCRWPTI